MLRHRNLFLVAAFSIVLQIVAAVVATEYGDGMIGTNAYRGFAKQALYYLSVLYMVVAFADTIVHRWKSLQIWLLYPVFLVVSVVALLVIGKPG